MKTRLIDADKAVDPKERILNRVPVEAGRNRKVLPYREWHVIS